MAKRYQVTPMTRFVNGLMGALIRLGFGPKNTALLAVRGRKSGRLYTIPVNIVEEGDQRWLVSPYGEVNWVRNARASGQATLRQGQKSETVKLTELGPEESAPVLKAYLNQTSIVQPYFDADPGSPLEAYQAEAERHPVFKLQPIQ